MHSGQEPTHANADFDSDARDSYLVSCLKLVSAQAFVIYRMDPYVVVFRPSALGCRVVGFSSQGTGPDLYSRASWVRPVVLDTPADCNTRVEWIWRFSQQQKNAEKAYLAGWRSPKGVCADARRASPCPVAMSNREAPVIGCDVQYGNFATEYW
jgi:hypothetical protein